MAGVAAAPHNDFVLFDSLSSSLHGTMTTAAVRGPDPTSPCFATLDYGGGGGSSNNNNNNNNNNNDNNNHDTATAINQAAAAFAAAIAANPDTEHDIAYLPNGEGNGNDNGSGSGSGDGEVGSGGSGGSVGVGVGDHHHNHHHGDDPLHGGDLSWSPASMPPPSHEITSDWHAPTQTQAQLRPRSRPQSQASSRDD